MKRVEVLNEGVEVVTKSEQGFVVTSFKTKVQEVFPESFENRRYVKTCRREIESQSILCSGQQLTKNLWLG